MCSPTKHALFLISGCRVGELGAVAQLHVRFQGTLPSRRRSGLGIQP